MRGTSLLKTYVFSSGNKNDKKYYLQNAHDDVVDLFDADGETVRSYRYDAFGVEKNIVESDVNPFRYCGEYYDKETGTIYLRARSYDPSIGRFISRDSFAGKIEDPLSLNLYTYCHNNPILGIDPSGHFKLSNWAKVVIGTVAIGIGVAATVATGGAAAPALLGAAKIVAASTISSAAISGAIGYATSGKEGLKQGLVNGAADGFMWGGIGAGVSQTISAVRNAKSVSSSKALIQSKQIDNPAHSSAQYDKLKQYYKYSEKYGEDGVKELSNEKYRFYGKISPAKTPGEMMGRRYVREWNPSTGRKRGWNETLDHLGRIRQVRPDVSLTGGNKVHYRFDSSGKYIGKW